jgi:hypothetical protein
VKLRVPIFYFSQKTLLRASLCLVFLFIGIFVFSAKASAQTAIYRSVGAGATSALSDYLGSDMNISGTTATFTDAQPDNVGIGDAIQYDSDYNGSIDSIAFISARIDSTHYTVQKADGSAPTPTTSDYCTWQIFRAYQGLAYAESGYENEGLSAAVINFDTFDGAGLSLVGLNYEWNFVLYSNGSNVDSDYVDFYHWTTGSNNYINIFAPTDPSQVGISQRHNGTWGTGYMRTERLSIDNNYMRIDGVSMRRTGNIYGYFINGSTGVGNIEISNCFGWYAGSSSHHVFDIYGVGALTIKMWNNIAINTSTAQYSNGFYFNDYDVTVYAYNNTSIVAGVDGSAFRKDHSDVGVIYLTNNIGISASGDDFYGFGANATLTNNASADTTADDFSGTGNIANQTFQFVDATNYDYHLSSVDNSAFGAGADLHLDSVIPFSTDIDGQNRLNSFWDIGADQAIRQIYRSAAPGIDGVLANGATNHLNISGSTATFDTALPDNVGVGDALEYDDDNDGDIDADDSIAFITARTDSTHYTIKKVDGSAPTTPSAADEIHWNINRAYTSLANAESGIESTVIDPDLRNFDNWTAGGDATTDDVGKDLFTANEQWNIALYANETTADQTAVTINGWTTASANYLRVYTPTSASEVGTSQRHAGKWDNTKYKLQISTEGHTLEVRESYTQIEGLQIQSTTYAAEGSVYGISLYDPGASGITGIRIDNNIIRSGDNSYALRLGIKVDPHIFAPVYIWNNVIYNFSTVSGYGMSVDTDYGTAPSFVYNNTIINSTTGIYSAYSDTKAINNIVKGSTDAFSGSFANGSDYNATDIADSTVGEVNTNPIHDKQSQIFVFIDETNKDFHLSPSDTAAKDAGADLTSDSYLPFTTDIDGATRTGTWDIGADENTSLRSIYRSVGVGATTALATGGSNALTVSGSTATFASAPGTSIGVGDVIQYDSNSDDVVDSIAFIHERVSETEYTVKSASGGTPNATGQAAGYAYVNGGGASSSSSSSVISSAINSTAGNTILVSLITADVGTYRSVSSVSDSAGNTYTRCGSAYQVYVLSAYYINEEIWVAHLAAGNASNEVSAIFSASATAGVINATQYSGLAASSMCDTGYNPGGSLDSSAPFTTTAATTSQDNEVVVGFYGNLLTASSTFSSSSPSTLRNQYTSIAVVTTDASTIGSYSTAVTSNRTTDIHTTLARAFKVADSGQTTNTWSIFRAYTSLSDAEAGTENTGIADTLENFDTWSGGRDLVTNSQQWNIALYTGSGADTNYVEVSGWTTSADNYLRIYTPYLSSEVGTTQRHEGVFDVSKYYLSISDWDPLDIIDNYVRVDGLQISMDNTSNRFGILVNPTGAHVTYITSNIIRATVTASVNGDGIHISTASVGQNTYLWNNIIYGQTSAGIGFEANSYSYIYNNTVADNGVYGIGTSGNNTVVANNIAVGNGTQDFYVWSGVWNASSDYNVSSDATAPGTHKATGKTNNTAYFVDYTGHDYHLKGSSSSLFGLAGTSLSGSFTVDVDVDTRSAWDIGADEYIDVGGPIAFTQSSYRWYANADSLTPGSALASENTALVYSSTGTPIRLRMNVFSSSAVAIGTQAFKLQWSTTSDGSWWKDVGTEAVAWGWRFKNNASVADGAEILGTLLSASNIKGVYKETNESTLNPNLATANQKIEYDFALDPSILTYGETYYFRMVKVDGASLDTYTVFPTITAGAVVVRGGGSASYAPVDNGVSGGGTGQTGGGQGGGTTSGGGTVVLQQGLNGYTGVTDTYISSYDPTVNYATDQDLAMWLGDSFGSLIKFNLSTVPAGATVSSATLGLYAYEFTANGGGDTVYVYRLLRDWVDTQANWSVYKTGSS